MKIHKSPHEIMKIMKIIELQMRIMKNMKIIEVHARFTKIMKILKFEERIIELMKKIRTSSENHKQNNENVRFQLENQKNHDIKEFYMRIMKVIKIK